MTRSSTDPGALFGDGRADRLAPLAGPRRGFDPWIVGAGWVEGWVLDMCDAREPGGISGAPAPRRLPVGARLRQWLRARRAHAAAGHGVDPIREPH